MSGARCGGCTHAAHRGVCPRKGPSGCVPFEGGIVCGARPPCGCAWRECKCGASVANATLDTDRGIDVPVLRGSAGNPEGLLEVWASYGTLMCRELTAGELVAEGRWRGVEHDGPCQPLWAGKAAEILDRARLDLPAKVATP